MIVVCGEALVDFTPARCAGGPGYVPRAGGSPCNVAVALGRLEVPAAFLGRLSTDAFGRLLRGHLAASGVDLRYVREGPEPTALAFVHATGAGEPEFAFYGTGSADRMLRPEDLPAAFPSEVSALHFGSLSLVLEPAASTLGGLLRREHGERVICLDPNVRPSLIDDRDAYRRELEDWIRHADVVKVSRADLSWLYPGDPIDVVAARWQERGPAIVAVTLGARGARARGLGGWVDAPSVSVRVRDTVGAGYAFTAGLLAHLYRTGRLARDALRRLPADDLARALGYANRVAAFTCARAGADPPRRGELGDI